MSSRQPTRASAKPWVEWFANRIDDPVARLKFLQSVTPLAAPSFHRQPFWQLCVAAIVVLAVLGSLVIVRASTRVKPVAAATRPKALHAPTAPPASPVWLVDKSTDSETYSNGLRIDTRFETANHPRAYLAFPADRPDRGAGVHRTGLAGIVFHTTESRQIPFRGQRQRRTEGNWRSV